MKLEVGMYVRTKRDGIGKIISLSIGEENECCFIELSKRRTGIKEHNIVKASHNLLGNDKEPCLIEVGDYVNDKKIVDIGFLTNGPEEGTKVIDYYIAPNTVYYLKEEDIKSIVTKECFANMEYKVGE